MRVNLKSTRNQEAQLGPRRTRRYVRLGQCELVKPVAAQALRVPAERSDTRQNGLFGLGPR